MGLTHTGWPPPQKKNRTHKRFYYFYKKKNSKIILILYTRTSGHVGENYGPNFSSTDTARIKFMNFSQKYMGSGGGAGGTLYMDGSIYKVTEKQLLILKFL